MLLIAVVVMMQFWIIQLAHVWTHNDESGELKSFRKGWVVQDSISAAKLSSESTTSMAHQPDRDQTVLIKPRILVGIISDSHTELAKTYRIRHRKLFTLWNDTRLCSFNDFVARNHEPKQSSNDDECQILYTFVLGAYTRNSTAVISPSSAMSPIPTIRLQDTLSNPLTVPEMPIKQPQYDDAFIESDVTILNIVENMNDGKTPTFLFWASQVAKEWNIPYVSKCDSDTFLRLPTMLQFLEHELPITTPNFAPSILTGALRHKAYWTSAPSKEAFWRETFYSGMHLYLSGSFYLMSRDLAEMAVTEARQLFENASLNSTNSDEGGNHDPSYLEGHEDHDAISMIQVGHERHLQFQSTPTSGSNGTVILDAFIQWIVIPKKCRFWEHPVKGKYRWGRIWARELRRKEEGVLVAPTFDSPLSSIRDGDKQSTKGDTKGNGYFLEKIPPTLLVVIGATDEQLRQRYRDKLIAQGSKICTPIYVKQHNTNLCDLYYFFIIEGEVSEDVTAGSGIVSLNTANNNDRGVDRNDVVKLSKAEYLDGNVGPTVILKYIKSLSNGSDDSFAFILFCKASHMVNLPQWFETIARPLSESSVSRRPHHLLIGDVRDKAQQPREFPSYRGRAGTKHGEEIFFHDEHENIHLYLGGDCFAISSTLLPVIASQEGNPENKGWIENHMGHDFSYLAYKANRTILHWVPITKSFAVWNPF